MFHPENMLSQTAWKFILMFSIILIGIILSQQIEDFKNPRILDMESSFKFEDLKKIVYNK
jgi:hypothetical protein